VKVLITGASGQVGRALVASRAAEIELVALTRSELDVGDSTAVRDAVGTFRPDLIMNAAAYTAVDAAESDQDRAYAVNAQGPRNLADSARLIGACRLLHISTDYVFDGRATEPYRPHDATNPLSTYGRTKLQGEQLVLERLPQRSAVIRTAWVYASQGKNFVLTMLRLMRERGAVSVVSDQVGSPTSARSVANVLWRLAALADQNGIFHWTDAGIVSRYDFARAIAEDAASLGLLSALPQVAPVTTVDGTTLAPRPKYSALDLRASIQQLGLAPIPWRTSLQATLSELATAPRKRP
jgi:dTDP-4-dehydrorhamnose reductase